MAAVAAIEAVELVGLEPHRVRVEASVATSGLPNTRVVGLPDAAVREAADRVRSAVERSGLSWPTGKTVVNLAPAALRKAGSGFDLPLALSVLAASGQLPASALAGGWAVGELGLDGSARDVPGVLPIAAAVRRFGGDWLMVPTRSSVEASLVGDIEVVPIDDLGEAVALLRGERRPRHVEASPAPGPGTVLDLADVRGQPVARRALELAAAGGHHLLLAGPPGCGKSMLARRLPALLPPLSVDEALEAAAIRSVAGVRPPDAPLETTPPFEEPHHTTSTAGLVGGGGAVPRPGAVSLAHRGVLFLDELLEVPRWTLDALREPLESGRIVLTRARASVRYPARFLLVAATNPCPCGNLGSDRAACRCRPDLVSRYRARLSGPLLDRIDLQVELRAVDSEQLLGPADGEATAPVATRIVAARELAAERQGAGVLNRDVSAEQVRRSCDGKAVRILARAVRQLGMSARAFDRCLRVARTIADVDGRDRVTVDHVEEAVAYRLADAAVPV